MAGRKPARPTQRATRLANSPKGRALRQKIETPRKPTSITEAAFQKILEHKKNLDTFAKEYEKRRK